MRQFRNSKRMKLGLTVLLSAVCMVCVVGALVSCGFAPSPIVVQGPGQFGNDPPTLSFLEPAENITRGQGDPFLIRWTDRDRDDNAQISFLLEDTTDTGNSILLVEGIDENDLTGPDAFTVRTTLIPVGTYYVLGVIDDGTNAPVEQHALLSGTAVNQRVVVTIVGPGEGPQTQPPIITVTEPTYNLSVAQDDTLTVVVQPSLFAPNAAIPFDPDSRVTLYILLDTDLDPNNDDPANPDPSQIIVLRQPVIDAGDFGALTFEIPIDSSVIPPRPDGEPYFIRASADDGTNPRVHQYAVGTINVVQLAAGTVDLNDIGRTKSGAKFYGFNPGARLGSEVANVGDFDADGVDDFMLVAQFGNPRNVGTVGEAYLVYGQTRAVAGAVGGQTAGDRFGGSIPVNSVSETISGAIFEAPPVRTAPDGFTLPGPARTNGIVDVDLIRDLSGDGRPEILFGLPHVHGAFDAVDYDPADEDLTQGDQTVDRELVYRQNLVTLDTGQQGAFPISQLWAGVEEVTISRLQPNTSFGSSEQLTWQDDGQGDQEWALIKFKDLLGLFPDGVADIDITSVRATIEFRVFNTGGTGTVHEAITNFDERETYSTYAQGGGPPVPGVDYVDDGQSVGNIDGQTVGTVALDVSDLVQELIDGQLAGQGNELRFIIVADPTDGVDQTAVRSSEFTVAEQRPSLTIEYTRENFLRSVGCYPDLLVNNLTDSDAQGGPDVQWYAGGMALYFNSENRDTEPRFSETPDRLENTAVALELVGQESGAEGGWRLARDGTDDSGLIGPRAD
ncbi:MAG: DNRLRE domain-containing protein, partial [Phycisphaerae bacterium]